MERLKVLIIDDDKDTAHFFSVVLSLVGFECEIIYSAKLALARLLETTPDMILLDMRLGLEIGGEDILYQIRSNPRFDQTRVIVVTAYPALAEPVTNMADLILIKPVDVDQLTALASRLSLCSEQTRLAMFRDPTTDLYNKEFFITRLELAFERYRRRSDFKFGIQVFAVDIQRLNDRPALRQDHEFVLRQLADRLRRCYRPTDTLARLENDKFITLHEDLKHPDDIRVIVLRLHQTLSPPFCVDDRSYTLQYAVGAAVHTSDYYRPIDLMDAANRALGNAHRLGEDQILFHKLLENQIILH